MSRRALNTLAILAIIAGIVIVATAGRDSIPIPGVTFDFRYSYNSVTSQFMPRGFGEYHDDPNWSDQFVKVVLDDYRDNWTVGSLKISTVLRYKTLTGTTTRKFEPSIETVRDAISQLDGQLATDLSVGQWGTTDLSVDQWAFVKRVVSGPKGTLTYRVYNRRAIGLFLLASVLWGLGLLRAKSIVHSIRADLWSLDPEKCQACGYRRGDLDPCPECGQSLGDDDR